MTAEKTNVTECNNSKQETHQQMR